MRSFRLYKSNNKGFRIFKNPIFLSVIISLIVGLAAGVFSSVYLSPLFVKEKEEELKDLFLETFIPKGEEKILEAILGEWE